MLPEYFIGVSIFVRLLSGASYATATWRKTTRPQFISWSLWALTALMSFGVSLAAGRVQEALVSLALGVGPLFVCAVALHRRNLETTTGWLEAMCIAIAVGGLVLWLVTDNPLHAILCAIIADIASSFPTIRKSYLRPHSEYVKPYMLTVLSMSIALLTFDGWQLQTSLFPAYILLINVTFVSAKGVGLLRKRSRSSLKPVPVY